MNRIAPPLLATSLSGLAMWLLAGLWHTVLMATFYTERVHGEHQGIGLILLAYLLLAALMTWIHRRGAAERPVIEGLKVGALVGILWVFPHELAMAGAHGEPLGYVLRNGAWHLIEQAVGGLVIGAVYRMWERKERREVAAATPSAATSANSRL